MDIAFAACVANLVPEALSVQVYIEYCCVSETNVSLFT